ncbi:MAG: YoaK family protein [Alphaproteobacteria bacterium]
MTIRKSINYVGGILAFVAGAINAGGFFAVGHYTSHMTGIASSIADHIVVNNVEAALLAAGFIIVFISGAATTSLIVHHARTHRLPNEYVPALILESILLLVFALGHYERVGAMPFWETYSVLLLCFIMGLQNAIITKISNARIRTTHITGLVTDIGIGIGRYLHQFFFRDTLPADRTYDVGLYVLLVLSFVVGGVSGAYAYQLLGYLFTVPLVLIMMLLAASLVRN